MFIIVLIHKSILDITWLKNVFHKIQYETIIKTYKAKTD
jgi:hypothetical protein